MSPRLIQIVELNKVTLLLLSIMVDWYSMKKGGENFYNKEYFAWQSQSNELGGKIQADILFQEYINENDVVLDFGCGGGATIYYVNCGKRYGYDVNPCAREAALKRGINVVASIDEIEDESLDAVISNHALEHTPNPYEILVNLKKKLKVGGKFIIYVPSMEDELGKLNRQNNIYDKTDQDNHLFGWNFQLLSNLFIYAGYEIEDTKTKKYSRTTTSDNSYIMGGRDLFKRVADAENIHPQTFVYAVKK